MKPPKYIVVKIGQFADGKGSGAYQVFERCGDALVYEVVDRVQNDSVHLRVALRRLQTLEDGEVHA